MNRSGGAVPGAEGAEPSVRQRDTILSQMRVRQAHRTADCHIAW